MRIVVVGRQDQFLDFQRKVMGHDVEYCQSHQDLGQQLDHADVVFDFLTSEYPDSLQVYRTKTVTVFLNTWKYSLAQLIARTPGPSSFIAFGFNGFPTMFSRDVLEVSSQTTEDREALKDLCEQLGTSYAIVDDRVGFVSPRVICMIINEAYFTVQEGTASREDIDLAMRLGTNYPGGPFEWAEKIGVKCVYELLDALYQDTKDPRYMISALLRKEYLQLIAAR